MSWRPDMRSGFRVPFLLFLGVNRGVSITDPLGAATADIDGDCRLGPPDVGPDEAG